MLQSGERRNSNHYDPSQDSDRRVFAIAEEGSEEIQSPATRSEASQDHSRGSADEGQ